MPLETLLRPGDLIGGHFVRPKTADAVIEKRSPADTSDLVSVHDVSLNHVDAAIAAARRALPTLQSMSHDARVALLRRYQDRLRVHEQSIAECIAREVGKPLWDALAEARAMAGKVDLVVGPGTSWTRKRTVNELPGEIRYRPLGVLAVLGPFNFPGHLPNGQILPALLLGNTVVFKPSDKAPSTATWMAKAFIEAGLPEGALNIVQGGRETAERLVEHDEIDGILFTGSLEVGRSIVQANAHRPGRLVALELGGKNAAIVLDDADIERAVRQIAFAGFATSGQRCTATSRVYVTPKVADAFIGRLAEATRAAVVGYPLDPGVFMGPLISDEARRRLHRATDSARAAGFEVLVEGGDYDVEHRLGYYARPSLHLASRADLQVDGYTDEELFGPDIALYVVDDLAQAVALTNRSRFGLAAAVFTSSHISFERAAAELRVGVLHWNRSSAGASGKLPFGGIGDSGNHHAAGVMAGQFCSYPQAVLLRPTERTLPTWPGLFDGGD